MTTVCPPCTVTRQERDGALWFAVIRDDAWRAYPMGNWDKEGNGVTRDQAAKTKATVKKRGKSKAPVHLSWDD